MHEVLSKKAWQLNKVGYNTLKKTGGFHFVKAMQVDNLKSVHEKRNTKIPALKHQGVLFGLTSLAFANHDKNKHRLKDPKETPYSLEGRKIHEKRTGNKPPLLRADELLSIAMSKGIISDKEQNAKKKYTTMMKYNFEFYLNRARAYNRDKGKCRVCSKEVSVKNVNIHHESPLLPLNLVNKTQHLATVHETCHKRIHDGLDYSHLPKKEWNKILVFREKLNVTHKSVSIKRNRKVKGASEVKTKKSVKTAT